jgi:hypothetical protein
MVYYRKPTSNQRNWPANQSNRLISIHKIWNFILKTTQFLQFSVKPVTTDFLCQNGFSILGCASDSPSQWKTQDTYLYQCSKWWAIDKISCMKKISLGRKGIYSLSSLNKSSSDASSSNIFTSFVSFGLGLFGL